MNQKKRWKIAIIIGIFLNIFLITTIFLILSSLNKNQVENSSPLLTLEDYKIPPPKKEVLPSVKPLKNTINPQKTENIVKEKNTIKEKTIPKENPKVEKTPVPEEKVPPRYHIPSLKGVNLAAQFDPLNPPKPPKPLPSNKNPILPDDIKPFSGEKKVEITFLVEKDGSVKRADVTKSSGNERIDNIALATIYTWHFEPMKTGYLIPIQKVFIFSNKNRTKEG